MRGVTGSAVCVVIPCVALSLFRYPSWKATAGLTVPVTLLTRAQWVVAPDATNVRITGRSKACQAGHRDLGAGRMLPGGYYCRAPGTSIQPSGRSNPWHLIFPLWKTSLLCINSVTRQTLRSAWQPRKILQGRRKGWDGSRRQCQLCQNRGRLVAPVLAVTGDRAAFLSHAGQLARPCSLSLFYMLANDNSYCSHTCLQREINWWQNFSASPRGKWVRFGVFLPFSAVHLVSQIWAAAQDIYRQFRALIYHLLKDDEVSH